MRIKTDWKHVLLTKEVHAQTLKDKRHFQKSIGGGKWSINDTIKEYQKILKGVVDDK